MTTRKLFSNPYSPTTDDWYTPPDIFTAMGIQFDIDVAAPPGGVPWIPATKHFTLEDNGLTQPWDGVIWCNPPYSVPGPWCHKYAEHGDGIILLRADVSVRAIHRAFEASLAIHAPPKRLQFVDVHGDTRGAVAFSTILLARGPQSTKALQNLAANRGGSTRLLIDPKSEWEGVQE